MSSSRRKPEWKRIMDEVGLSEYAEYAEYADLPDVPRFPLHALPRPARRLVEEAAESIQCPPEFIGVPLLVSLGCAIGNSRRVKLKEGWDEGAALYAAVIADPGDKKTPAYKVAVQAAVKRESQLRLEHQEKEEEYQSDLRDYEVDKADAKKNHEAAPPPPEPPKRKRALIEDTTIEALAGILNHNPRGVFVVRDELAAWKRSMDQYRSGGKGADRQFWLSAWSNSYASVDRKGNAGPIVLAKPFLGVFGSIQPDVLPELSGDREDGLLDRFLFAYPPSMRSRWSDSEISANTVGNVKWLYDKLAALEVGEDEYGDPEPTLVPMTQDARVVFIDLANALREEMEEAGFPSRLKGPWAKLEAYLARFSLILGMCRTIINNSDEEAILPVDVLAASVFLDYFKAHAKKVYIGLYGENERDRLAVDVARFLKEQEGGAWEGEPEVFYSALQSRYKPKAAKDLTRALKQIATRTPALSFDPPKPENYYKEDGKRSTRRIMRLRLDPNYSTYSLYSAYSEEDDT